MSYEETEAKETPVIPVDFSADDLIAALSTSKPWYRSKTLWANVFTVLIAILGLLGAHPLLEQYSDHILLVMGVIGILLRFVTDQPLSPNVGAVIKRRIV